MPLSRAELVKLAVDDYFIALNNHQRDGVLATFAEDCVMRFPGRTYRYDGIAALTTHFDDFLSTFPGVDFHDFHVTADADSQSIAVLFEVTLTDGDGAKTVMQNCNFFYVNAEGRFREIVIYATGPIQKGFEAGSN